ncbi:hypothetical protein F5878DRAFT_607983 [Lentinula raphanica]|uniref:Uncharacterized protein n=1 Tax=Lentinula raphanica TaxID=153919 RepID=A0AA38PG26_9AGAR|nr:hypothetical protein F5878DRAFT_607983 [Lentinula raphanica]
MRLNFIRLVAIVLCAVPAVYSSPPEGGPTTVHATINPPFGVDGGHVDQVFRNSLQLILAKWVGHPSVILQLANGMTRKVEPHESVTISVLGIPEKLCNLPSDQCFIKIWAVTTHEHDHTLWYRWVTLHRYENGLNKIVADDVTYMYQI